MKTLNIGAGQRTYKEYPEGYKCINLDIRKLENIDVISDVRKLPFGKENFDYILASDIVEHFPIAQTNDLLKEWARVLKPGGIIEFRTPNLKVICRNYVMGTADAKFTSWLLYGGQGYPENFHYVGFDRNWLRDIIVPLGFKEVFYKDDGNNFIMKVEKNG